MTETESLSWVWTTWLIAVGVSFVVLEGYAYFAGGQMLTGWVRIASRRWPWTPYVFALTCLVLIWHFWFERRLP